MMRIVLFAIAAVLSATSAHAGNWPKVPFMPSLTVVADGSEGLCAQYQDRVRADYFKGHPGFSAMEGRTNFKTAENTPMEQILGVPDLEYPPLAYKGNVDGDNLEDQIILRRIGGGNNVDYRDYFYVLRLTGPDISWLRKELGPGDQPKLHVWGGGQSLRDRQLDVWLSFFKDRVGERMKRAERYEIGRSAYPLIDSFSMLSYQGRLYADVLTPRNMDNERILLSFDHDMTPKTECAVAVKTPLAPHIEASFEGTRFAELLDASAHIAGNGTRCPSGSSHPFFYQAVSKRTFLHQAIFQPWRITSFVSRWGKVDNYRQWSFNGAQYFWSLEGAANRRAYQTFERHSGEAAAELAEYFQQSFDFFDKQQAFGSANIVVNFLRQRSSESGEYYFGFRGIDPDALLASSRGSASADTYFSIASAYLRPYGASKSDLPPKDVLDRHALNLALRLAASADAPPKVLGALVERGAAVDYGIESNLLVAVDLDGPRRFLLKHGADPNRPNYFGKTPLMMAAHMNSSGAVRDLLAAGAAIEARTYGHLPGEDNPSWHNPNWLKSCEYVLKFRNRTALMYAAENASPEIIRILLKAGADATAVDTGGRGMLDYLSRNEALSPRERKKARRLLTRAGAVH